MKIYKVLTVFDHDTLVYCFDNTHDLLDYIKYNCDSEDSLYIEQKWLSQEMIKKLNIIYVKGDKKNVSDRSAWYSRFGENR